MVGHGQVASDVPWDRSVRGFPQRGHSTWVLRRTEWVSGMNGHGSNVLLVKVRGKIWTMVGAAQLPLLLPMS